MSSLARSITVFGMYLSIAGLCFIFIPNIVLPLLGFAPTTEVWIRLLGLLTANIGIYFLYSVRHNDHHFYRATLYTRMIFFSGVIFFVIFKLASPLLILFGLVDLAGAAWTWAALRSQK
jgi:hypothetical protein